MTLIPFSLELYEDLVDMYHSFISEVYGSKRRLNSKYFFHKEVQHWIDARKEIVIVANQDNVIGFSVSYIDNMSGMTEDVYNGDIAYVKPEYRKTKAGYLLYKNILARAEELNMNLVGNGRVENGVDMMLVKHFSDGSGTEHMFSVYERRK